MSKVAVVYCSKYGSTKKYAEWIAEETGAELFKEKECRVSDLKEFDTVVYGGGIHAGGITGLDFIRKGMSKLKDKRILVFAVGLNVGSPETQQECREINFVKKIKDLPCYFMPGAYDPEKVTGVDKKLMSVVRKMIGDGGEDGLTEDQKKLIDAIENGADYTDRSAIKPLVEEILRD